MSAGDRLKEALTALKASSSGSLERVTVSALCELAKVSRNSLYRYHPGVLLELRKHQRASNRHAAAARPNDTAGQQHEELVTLRRQIPKLVALADHYYSAYREVKALLDRREKELAELRQRLDSKPIRLIQR